MELFHCLSISTKGNNEKCFAFVISVGIWPVWKSPESCGEALSQEKYLKSNIKEWIFEKLVGVVITRLLN